MDPGSATPGKTFMIHQHHATRLHFDLRLAQAAFVLVTHQVGNINVIPGTHGHAAVNGDGLDGGVRENETDSGGVLQAQLWHDRGKIVAVSA